MTDLPSNQMPDSLEIATLGGGCFWCVEAVYQQMEGVAKVVSGYSGGHVKNPTYREVCGKKTGHVEVVQVYFDPTVTSYAEILEVFWRTHDPTTMDRQGNDVGPQYRSVIFTHDDRQLEIARASKEAAEEAELWPDKIVTQIEPIKNFYVAENFHQDYFANNPNQPYCMYVVAPKVEKFKKLFKEKMKKPQAQ
ncbi:peptide-methionine (S)-S-oxide reductase MsrA [Pontibacter sp. G13]|uniref:peptide-methionine (S)-S-oxide reductase MsrA n=1 Tax=Pontibacter sp. G13 TaxID=3074898 RepID=UPI00288904A3|nr:peptide-methionine (S)-S-oxide reductase MsrA [Pontibacter sp. G13]WNJ20982.1 peptide-methionine (S)-S-oxide reductase MsrA [Pontibacter sp. G13]